MVAGADPVAPPLLPRPSTVGAATARWPTTAGAGGACRPGLAEWAYLWLWLVGGTGSFGATASGPKPVFVTASADGGGLGPSISTGTPAALARFKPFSTVSIAGSSRRNSRMRSVDVDQQPPRRGI